MVCLLLTAVFATGCQVCSWRLWSAYRVQEGCLARAKSRCWESSQGLPGRGWSSDYEVHFNELRLPMPDSFVPKSLYVCFLLPQPHWQWTAAASCCKNSLASLPCKRVAAWHRAKYGESAFLEVYQKLYEAPDPSAVLVNAAVRPLLTLAALCNCTSHDLSSSLKAEDST